MGNRVWVYPAIVLTAINSTIALTLHPEPFNLLALFFFLFPLWMIGTAGYLCVPVFIEALRMMRAGVNRPISKIAAWIDWRLAAYIASAMALAGLNKIAFLWLKPTLNIYVPFSADPLLAAIDNTLFFGNDPWTFLEQINTPWSGFVYHPIWYFTMLAALIVMFAQDSSVQKSAMALSYFLLWSVFGPLVHILLPAGGPIFFERLGYGARFALIDGGPETQQAADYLWYGFVSGKFDVASGISAMPSLHVTMAVWTVICISVFARKWLPLIILSSSYVTLLSVSLGWHYAIDGIVGGVCAVAVYRILLVILRRYEAREQRS